jgi:hypothetical protein
MHDGIVRITASEHQTGVILDTIAVCKKCLERYARKHLDAIGIEVGEQK